MEIDESGLRAAGASLEFCLGGSCLGFCRDLDC